MKNNSLRVAVTVVVLLVSTASALAQTSKGFLVGNIVDADGAVIVGATVKVTNLSTGVSRETVSAADGGFRIDALDPGAYRIEISQSGFKALTRDNVLITAAQTTDIQFQLDVGAPTEVVSVTSANDVVLQTQDGVRINTLSKREITDLPTPALNPASIVFTLPGV